MESILHMTVVCTRDRGVGATEEGSRTRGKGESDKGRRTAVGVTAAGTGQSQRKAT